MRVKGLPHYMVVAGGVGAGDVGVGSRQLICIFGRHGRCHRCCRHRCSALAPAGLTVSVPVACQFLLKI